jgi:hypothetical protein
VAAIPEQVDGLLTVTVGNALAVTTPEALALTQPVDVLVITTL